jgi:hypothetical protein
MNIVDMIQQSIRGEVSEKLGHLIGEDQSKTQTAASAAVPALLGSLMHLGSTPDGARRLTGAVENAEDPTSHFTNVASGQGANIVDSGRSMLSSLFGSETLNGLTGAISRFTGLGTGSTMGLLGGLLPMVLSTLKRVVGSSGAAGVTDLLAGQKKNIAASMPSGLSSLMSGVPGMSQFTAPVKQAAESVAGAGRRAAAGAGEYGQRAASTAADYGERASAGGASWLRWALPLLILALIGWGIYHFTQSNTPVAQPNAAIPPATQPMRAQGEPQPGEAVPAAGVIHATAGQANAVTDKLKAITATGTESLSKITDPESADAALPSLRDLGGKVDDLSTSYNALPASTRSSMAPVFSSTVAPLQTAAQKAMDIPGVEAKIKPVVQPLLDKLNAMAKPEMH